MHRGLSRRGLVLFLGGALLVATPHAAYAVTIGNVTSHSTAGQDVTFNINDNSKVRISILAPDAARVQVAPDGQFTANISRAVVETNWPVTPYTIRDNGSAVTMTTNEMKLVIQKTPFLLECYDRDDQLILSDDPARRIQWDSARTQVYKTTQTGEKYVGLGWRTLGLVRNGTRFQMNNVPTYNDSEVFYSGIPLWYGIRNGCAYGLFFDDTSWGTIDMTTTGSGYMSFKNLGGTADYYYFAGPTIAHVLNRYTQLTGRPYMPPKWSVGYQQCRWSYTPQPQVLDIANQFRTRNIPCDVLYLDIDYMPGGQALMFDSAKFPDPGDMIATLHSQGFHVVANISPFLFAHDPKHATAQNNNYFLRKANNDLLWGWHNYWYFVGGADTGSMNFLDFSKTSARNWWQSQHTSFLSYGIDGIWNDLNEPDELGDPWPADVKYDFDGSPVNHNKTSTQYSLLQTQLSYDILADYYPGRRPFVVSRGGYAGIQRYATLWSGDNGGDWQNDYKRNIPMGLSMSISGNPHNGHDIGGFFGYPDANDKPSAELYTRWMQAGVFSPFCRQHHDGWGGHEPARPFVEPWEFGTTAESICRDFIRLRYRLMPYLYTLFHEAHVSGEPIQRPTLYDFLHDSNTLSQDYDFMFGPHLLVSPVTIAGVTTWNTYLPGGTDWISYWNDTTYTGGQTASTSVSLSQLPIFVRGGAIIPMGPVAQYDGQQPINVLTLELYPAGGESGFTLYEDDGISWNYLSGQHCLTTYHMSGQGDTFTLTIAAREGTYMPVSRSYLLKVHRWPGHTRAGNLNNVALTEYADEASFNAATQGCFLNTDENILYTKFTDTGGQMLFSFAGEPIVADLDHDGDADADDFEVFLRTFGRTVGDPDFNAEADYNDDDVVTFADYEIWLESYQTALGEPEAPAPLEILGDFNRDMDVDQEDFGYLQACQSGSGVTASAACEDADLDGDHDVDQEDSGIFLDCASGSNLPLDLSCKY